MNPVRHTPISVELSLLTLSPPTGGTPLYSLRMQYKETGHIQVFLPTYVPEPLVQMLKTGEIESLNLETLEVNSLAQRRLRGKPDYLVMAVSTKDGKQTVHVPVELLRAKLTYAAIGLFITAAAVIFLLHQAVWAGSLLAVLGSHLIRTSLRVPTNPHKVYAKQTG